MLILKDGSRCFPLHWWAIGRMIEGNCRLLSSNVVLLGECVRDD